MPRVHAFTDDALSDHDAVGLTEAIRSHEVSVPEVVDAAIVRVSSVDPQLGAVAYAAYDRARAEARAPRGGYFSGVPTFLKDNVDVQGMPTQEGTDSYASRIKRADGDFARMYLATGLLTLGKTQLSEYGFSATAEHPRLGAVRTPWDPAYVAGASSAGSAALVAAGAVPFAHANDGGGSIRIPAAVNGLVGLKPTRDRTAQDKLMRQMPIRIVSDGIVSRSVRDTAAFFREAEKVYRTLSLPPIGDITRPGKARLRIALNVTGIGHPPTPEVAEATREVARVLEGLGHHVEEIDAFIVPETFPDDFLLYWAFLAGYLVRTGRLTHGRRWAPQNLDNLTVGLTRHASRNLHRLPGAMARLRRGPALSAAAFEQYDALLTPTLAAATPQVGHLSPTHDYDTILERLLAWVAFTPLQNVTGDPAISLPLATASDGMPLGVMIGAGRGRETLLLELAYELEEAMPFARIQG